jgi:tripartite-type tricarboxylate transporter receptor subunit TctC
VIVPFAAGSTTDIIARAIADKMSQSMGQTLVIDNRGGASGTIGQQAVATAAPDGYTVMIHSSSHTVSPSTFAKLPFDTVGDFAGVTPISSLPNALVISPTKNIKTLPQLLAAARAKPGSMNFASAGQGSATHLNAEKFKMAAKIDATNIPFKGSGEAVTEVLSGRVDYYFSPIAPVIGQIKEGQLLALAVGSPKRAAALPDVPTTTEAGVPGSEFNFWIGMMAPAKTPRDIVNRLHDEVAKALATPEVKERFLKLGADAWTLKPEQFDAYIKEEIASNAAAREGRGPVRSSSNSLARKPRVAAMLRKLLLTPALRPFLLILLLLVLWDLVIRLFKIPAYLIPPPWEVVKQLVAEWPRLLSEAGRPRSPRWAASASRSSSASRWRWSSPTRGWSSRTCIRCWCSRRAFPKVAIAPLFVVWFGFGIFPR